MSSDEKTNRPTPDEERTVFAPAGASVPSQPPSAVPSERTSAGFTHAAPRADARVQVGDVLNHIFEVRRFIARGGMGEVFEGVNISSDERVAIKVMLPALTADPNVQAMFRKEARTLTRLNNEALVAYRVLAQEPNLGLLYIVTEYIEGPSLCDLLGKIQPSTEELRQLGLRLAKGLAEAHRLGAIHRDISPDNILLEGGALERAKIIDFGIAKDLDPSSKTIVGDGFAGKLGYVAPEQLGDFGRDVGPWSDIYSLGLVLLAVASGKNVDMGATLVDAVDRRRAGPDLGPIPDDLRPAIEGMLKPNPADRFRSMADVAAALSGQAAAMPAPPASSHAATVIEPRPSAPVSPVASAESSRTPLIAGGAAAALLVLGVGAYFAFGGSDSPAPAPTPVVEKEQSGSASTPAPSDARTSVNQALATVPCSWLDIVDLQPGPPPRVSLKGVAQNPAGAVTSIAQALQATGSAAGDVNSDRVTTIPASVCAVLDAFRSIRSTDQELVSIDRTDWTMQPVEGGEQAAEVLVNLTLPPPGREVAFFYVSAAGEVEPATQGEAATPVVTRSQMEKFIASPPPGATVTPLGASKYRLSGFVGDPGWSGFLMITGRQPIDASLVTTPPARRDAGWRQRFAAAAERGGWKAQMAWYRVIAN